MVVVEYVLIIVALLLLMFTNKLITSVGKRYHLKFICIVVLMVLLPKKIEMLLNLPLIVSLIITVMSLYAMKLIGDKF